MNRLTTYFLLLMLSISASGCGGAVDELPAEGGGTNAASPDEIKKQMEASMNKSGEMYKDKGLPGATPAEEAPK